uniref:Uncharacterized protein n=1 Tax=Anguilla anguilla TaxID=7936 RepID=A0A0E9XPJ9_ANGAN
MAKNTVRCGPYTGSATLCGRSSLIKQSCNQSCTVLYRKLIF